MRKEVTQSWDWVVVVRDLPMYVVVSNLAAVLKGLDPSKQTMLGKFTKSGSTKPGLDSNGGCVFSKAFADFSRNVI